MPPNPTCRKARWTCAILQIVAPSAVHGYAIARRIRQISRDVAGPPGLFVSSPASSREPGKSLQRNGSSRDGPRLNLSSPKGVSISSRSREQGVSPSRFA